MTVDLVVWDLDDVLHTAPLDFDEKSDVVAAQVACDLGFEDGMDMALYVAEQGLKKYSHPCAAFIKRYGIARDKMMTQWMENLDFSYLEPCPYFLAEIKKSSQQHVVLTQSRTPWADHILKKIGYEQVIDHVFGYEKHLGDKAREKRPFEHVLNVCGVKPEKAVMVDNLSENLKFPVAIGMKAVLIKNGKDIVKKHAHISVDKPYQAMRAINNREYPFI